MAGDAAKAEAQEAKAALHSTALPTLRQLAVTTAITNLLFHRGLADGTGCLGTRAASV